VVAGLRFRAEQYCQSSPAQSSSATADFGFSYVSADGTNGLSQPYAGPSYLGPYYIVRRTTNGAIDTAFGAKGYVKTFNGSDDTNDKFTSLCIVPGSGDHRHRTGKP